MASFYRPYTFWFALYTPDKEDFSLEETGD